MATYTKHCGIHYICRCDISHIIILHNHYVSLISYVVVARFTECSFVSVKSFCSQCVIYTCSVQLRIRGLVWIRSAIDLYIYIIIYLNIKL